MKQSKIDNDAHTTRLITVMASFGLDAVWTFKIVQDLLEWPTEHLQYAVNRLIKMELVSKHKNQLFVTDKGREFAAGAIARAEVAAPDKKFTLEALTGMDEDGKETMIEKAALPGTPKHYATQTTEDKLSGEQTRVQARKREASKLEITLEEFDKGVQSGQIKICKYCGQINIFDRRKKGGNTWQHQCRQCRKGARLK